MINKEKIKKILSTKLILVEKLNEESLVKFSTEELYELASKDFLELSKELQEKTIKDLTNISEMQRTQNKEIKVLVDYDEACHLTEWSLYTYSLTPREFKIDIEYKDYKIYGIWPYMIPTELKDDNNLFELSFDRIRNKEKEEN